MGPVTILGTLALGGTLVLLEAARRDAHRLDIGWVLVWPTPSRRATRARPAVLRYLEAAGFRFDYRADGVLVYRPASSAR